MRDARGRVRRLVLVPVLLVVLVAMSAGCGSATSSSTSTTVSGAASSVETTSLAGSLTVSAASSLTGAFTQIASDFEAANPDTSVELNFDASSSLAAQILAGVPADVFASADEANMTELVEADLVAAGPEAFARNELVIVTEPGNPIGIAGLSDLADAGVVALCGEEVPCGRFAAEALSRGDVTIDESRVTRGQNVKATLTAVTEGGAAAGIVYATDAAAAGDSVATVELPAEIDVTAVYPIGLLASTDDPDSDLAAAFADYVLSPAGQSVLASFGFLPPG